MTTLYDPSRNVKPTTSATFARGISPARRERRMPYSSADLAWAAYELNKDATDYDVLIPGPAPIRGGAPTDAEWDALAAVAEWQARYEMGLCL